jgi:hypothetical protein
MLQPVLGGDWRLICNGFRQESSELVKFGKLRDIKGVLCNVKQAMELS